MRLRVATLNIWGLAEPLSQDLSERIIAIGRELSRLGPDVIGFQEVWTREARDALIAAGRREGYENVWHNAETFGGSGLLILSRLTLGNARFTKFRLPGLPQRIHHGDYYAGKGFVIVDVQTAEGPVALLNSHLIASYVKRGEPDEYLGMRVGQVLELAEGMRSIELPLIAVGDFNLREDEPEHRVLMGLSGLQDAAAALDRRQATVLTANPYRGAGHEPEERIDYVLFRDGSERSARATSTGRVFDGVLELDGARRAYSDHAGLLTEIEIGGTPAPRKPVDAGALVLAQEVLAAGRREAEQRRDTSRMYGAGGGAAALATLLIQRRPELSRRRSLRALLIASGALIAGLGLGSAFLAERSVPDEIRSYDELDRILASFA